MKYSHSKLFTLLTLLFLSVSVLAQSNSKFRVVLDPGHGGKDSGTNHGKNVEKDIVLAVALEVGKILKKESDIEVVYTRDSDVFVAVKERSVMANNSNGNVFVSIHCNGVNSNAAYGTETYVMGLSKNKSNLDVAKTENSVIMLEDDYKTQYAGFDPKSPESIIGLTLIQEDYIHQSIDLASRVQDSFTNDLKRKNRGVKQGPFWVLHGAFMPSVLIELGFVSNKEEGAYLSSKKGQKELAESIATGIIQYKKAYYSNGVSSSVTVKENQSKEVKKTTPAKEKKTVTVTKVSKGVVFKVQIAASTRVLALKPQNFKGLKNVTMIKSGNLNKYYYSETSSYDEAEKLLKEAKDKGHSSSFIVPFKNGKIITLEEALK
ncbi:MULTISPECIES: N-acetylmuramoyl-L-alanine amidase [Myroides]|uniref:N-acetylmuramoyl-L-alanine amidase n=1 Tax=Myroides albus TaxID=2562892 RepID=A0A6I3LNQ7_9FLAO|nr:MULTISPECIES: N-acetylmuramoyl-L-alanine amidase [Myroides]MTG97625.1 N-acetylmuramoyl-L-alanine amidase [Myroides albus]MVX36755.1 N-acetylmuramoyl-L-alanine amidase [Myroides sp. LoEW2-1]UVD79249.1 N-acetylmuramoyl-L-alanine amidase [Myroides albus]